MYKHECRLDLDFPCKHPTNCAICFIYSFKEKEVLIYCVDILHMWEDTVINSPLVQQEYLKTRQKQFADSCEC